MTWNTTEADIIKNLVAESRATNENLKEIYEAIVGSIKDGGKPGLQDTVRDLGSEITKARGEIGVARGELVTHKAANKKDHKFIKRTIAGVRLIALVAILLNFDTATPIIGGLLKLILKIVT